MKTRKCKCPHCGSMNTDIWSPTAIRAESDGNDYLISSQMCNDCRTPFYTKSKIEIKYIEEVDTLLSIDEAREEGLL